MRRAIRGLVVAGLVAIGGLAGPGQQAAQAQGYGVYPGSGYGGYPAGGAYNPGDLGGGLNVGIGIGGYSSPLYASPYGGYGNVGYRPGYGAGYPHHHHRHHRGCGHHGY